MLLKFKHQGGHLNLAIIGDARLVKKGDPQSPIVTLELERNSADGNEFLVLQLEGPNPWHSIAVRVAPTNDGRFPLEPLRGEHCECVYGPMKTVSKCLREIGSAQDLQSELSEPVSE
jgi:hypothetical protein